MKALSSTTISSVIFTYFQPLANIENLFIEISFWFFFYVIDFIVYLYFVQAVLRKGFSW